MDYTNIPIEKFKFANKNGRLGDKKLETKPVSYAKDVWRRFCKNKSSVVAAGIIAILILFAILVPIFCANRYTENPRDTKYLQYKRLVPKITAFSSLGFWDGCKDLTYNKDTYNYWRAVEDECGDKIMTKIYKADYKDKENLGSNTTYYDVKFDTYTGNGYTFLDLTKAEYEALQQWQLEKGIQVIFPAVTSDPNIIPANQRSDANIYFKAKNNGAPVYDENGELILAYLTTGPDDEYHSLRIESDPGEGSDGAYKYATISKTDGGTTSYRVRVYKYNYFQFRYGFEPAFAFGTNDQGHDILTRLASAARFSLIFAVCISAINLLIGALIGAVEGYYGGIIDLVVERIIDILGGVPSMVVMSLFQLHLAHKIGAIPSMFFAFVLTGWIGMSARTRMQFYRFKHQEYVLSARTLGASDARLMFKHIFPNAMGTLITGSVLSIPGVIFSESSLTYLGIVNLDSSTMTSVGTMLANGRNFISAAPHIVLFPALFIALLMISFNLFGNGLRDAFNPSLKGVED